MHLLQEVLAGLGVVAGVALFFSVQVANGSISGSAGQILHAITGSASLQLAARDPRGFDADVFEEVRALPGVAAAAPLLEQRAAVSYGGRRVALELVGIDANLASLGGIATGTDNYQLSGLFLSRKPSIMLPAAMGEALRLPSPRPGREPPRVELSVRGRTSSVPVGAVVGAGQIGALSDAMLAAAPLRYAQELVGLPGRVSRVLVVPQAGQEQVVRSALVALADGRLTVSSIASETQLLAQATAPNDQATNLFAWIGALVALLFTFNAMLLTMPERRRAVAELRLQGAGTAQLVQIVGFQAIVLGTIASVVGLLVGNLLSQGTTHAPPGYLALAFPLGVQRVIDPTTVIVAFLAGLLVTVIAAAAPLVVDLRKRPVDAIYHGSSEPGNALSARTRWALLAAATALVAATSVLLFVEPSATIYGVAALAAATLLAIPAVFLIVLKIGRAPTNRLPLNTLMFALQALQATKLRSLALAATGAVAIFGSIAVEAAHRNLLHGLYEDYAQYVSSADIWIAHPDDDLAFQPFDDHGFSQKIRAVDGVAAVRPYFGGLLDVSGRRAWILARPASDRPMIPPSQIINGDLQTATAHLSIGGWATLSKHIADKRQLHVGDAFTLPTPTGTIRLRLAATTTNLGWGPGAIILNSRDYRRAWASDNPTAFEVQVKPGANPVATRRAIQDALGPNSALLAQTTTERATHANALARAGLARLSQISTLLLIAAALAMAAAIGTTIWQRRPALAQLQVQGGDPPQLWRSLLLETGLVLFVGCFTGALAGTYGHYLLDRWLQLTTGYPAPFAAASAQTLLTCLKVATAAALTAATVGYLAANAPTKLALNTDN